MAVARLTPGPLRRKLWKSDRSWTTIRYGPGSSCVTFWPWAFRRLIVKSGPTVPKRSTACAAAGEENAANAQTAAMRRRRLGISLLTCEGPGADCRSGAFEVGRVRGLDEVARGRTAVAVERPADRDQANRDEDREPEREARERERSARGDAGDSERAEDAAALALRAGLRRAGLDGRTGDPTGRGCACSDARRGRGAGLRRGRGHVRRAAAGPRRLGAARDRGL